MIRILFTVAVILFSVFQKPAMAQISGTLDPAVLPFTRPSRAAMAASSHKVLAHWHLYPFRYYTTDGYVGLLSPSGYVSPTVNTGSEYSINGGFLRGRPLPFAASPARAAAARNITDIRSDMLTDITLAAEIGIDAFLMNFWYGPSSAVDPWRWTYQMQAMFYAAEQYTAGQLSLQQPGFSVAPSIDAVVLSLGLNHPSDCSAMTGSTNADYFPETYADNVYSLMTSYPLSFMKLNSKYVVGVFGVEQLPLCWYQRFLSRLSLAHNTNNVYVTGVFLDPTTRQNYVTVLNAFGRWDVPHHYKALGPETADQTWAHSNNMNFVSNVSQSADIPHAQLTFETGGFQTLIGTWTRTINDQLNSPADMAEIITWNDHSEGTNLRPNTTSQYAYYDIAAYYIASYKMGAAPPITRDVLYYSHRMHLSTATRDPGKQPNLTQSMDNYPFDDTVYLTGFLAAGGTMSIVSGGATASSSPLVPGVHTLSAQLYPNDQPRFRLTVNNINTIDFLSAFHTRPNPVSPPPLYDVTWQDFLYRAGGSNRPAVTGVQNDLPQDRQRASD